MRFTLVCMALFLASCTVDSLDLSGRACPCVDGWVCVADVCVESEGTDAGPPPPDAGDTDAGDIDAGDIDAGPGMDGGPGDDAGPPMDAGPPDAGPFVASGCGAEHSGRLFCDSYEGDFTGWGGTEADGTGTVSIVTFPRYRGNSAMRVECPVGCGGGGSGADPFNFSPPPTELWLRAYYFFPSSNPPYLELQQIGDSDFFQTVVTAIWDSDVVNLHAHDYIGDAYNDYTYTVPLDRWVCVETHLSIDGTAGAVQLYFDDTLVGEETGLDTLPDTGNTIDTIAVGIVYKDASDPTLIVYVDEVVADTSRIGCD